ncbi:hypothetical protein [Nocardia sp. N2S4-5]|uniref:hypothetical protein n=1 Tax=Nocardia sp. N2S4-5 TaxID=3351565 RepID=UPI0037D8FE90
MGSTSHHPTVQRFRPRATVEAIQWPEHTSDSHAYSHRVAEIHRWVNDHGGDTEVVIDSGDAYTVITTPRGRRVRILHGDWIIRGTTGSFFISKPDAFASDYEPVSDGSNG